MTRVFKPSVWQTGDGSTVTELPKPIVDFSIADGWDIRKSKVPLADGETYDGHSINGPIIAVQGSIGRDTSGKYIDEETMFDRYLIIRSKLDISSSSEKYEFFIYHDVGSATYQKFKSCSTRSFELFLGDDDNKLFEYSLSVIAEDPVIYTTAPGD